MIGPPEMKEKANNPRGKREPGYGESLDFLYGLRWFGTKLGLRNVRRLLELMGDPQRELNFYHIAGTNGKGSTAAILQALLRTNYRRVGLFTSPHLEDFRERIRINDRLITPAEVRSGVKRLRPCWEETARFPGCRPPTYFEAVVALAADYFHRRRAEAVVWEVGLGGRLDATNVVIPRVAVITNISHDHSRYLGDTLESVAREKGGIIKAGVPTVTAETAPRSLRILKDICRRRGSELIEVGRRYEWERRPRSGGGQLLRIRGPGRTIEEIDLPLAGEHQALNFATAWAAWEAGEAGVGSISPGRIRQALAGVDWPGRFEIRRGKVNLIMDGAHNPAGARVLAAALREFRPDKKYTFILGTLADKDFREVCRTLLPLAARILTVRVRSERALSPETLARTCLFLSGGKGPPVLNLKTLESALSYCYHSSCDWVCLTGSLMLVGEARGKIKDEILNGQFSITNYQVKKGLGGALSHRNTVLNQQTTTLASGSSIK